VSNPFRVTLDLKLNRAALARTLERRHRNDLHIEPEAWHRQPPDDCQLASVRSGRSVPNFRFSAVYG
jgi:hypothetical protein